MPVDNVVKNSSRHITNGQNVQLEAQVCNHTRAYPQIDKRDSFEQVQTCLFKLDTTLEKLLITMTKQLEMEEHRLAWEKECETKRLQREKERMEKEYTDRELAREERRQEQLRYREERERLIEIITRSGHRLQTISEQPD